MPIERQPGGGLSGGSGNPFMGSTTPRLLATQLAAVAAAANGNPSVSGVARGPAVAQIVAVHHQPGHLAMYILHPSAQALSSSPFYSSAVPSGHGQPTGVSLISSAGVEGAIQAAATALQLQASPAMTAYSSSNAFLPRWKNSITTMQHSAEQSQQVLALKQMMKCSTNNKSSNSVIKSGIREPGRDARALRNSSEQNEILLKKISARPENVDQDAKVSKKRKSEKVGKPVSWGTTNSADQKQGMHPKPMPTSLPNAKNRKQAATARRSSSANNEQELAEKKSSSTSGTSHNNKTVFSHNVVCLNSNKQKCEGTTEQSIGTSAQQPTDKTELSSSASTSLHYYPIDKKQALKLQAQQYRQKVALQLAKSKSKSNGEDKSASNMLKAGENEEKEELASSSTESIQVRSFQPKEREITGLTEGVMFSKPSYSDSCAGSGVVSGSNYEKESNVEADKAFFSGFRIPEPDVDYPLAGPFVQGIISGNEEVLSTLDADDDISKNQMISRLLLALTHINEHEAKPTATLSLGEMESIAESLLVDRRVSQCEAVRVAFIEMKRRHDKIFRNYRNKLAKLLQQEEAENKVGLKAENNSEEKLKSISLSDDGQVYQGTLDSLQIKYETVIKNLTRIHSEKINQLEKELQQKDVERQQMVEAFRNVSAQAFGLWRKNHLS